MKNNFAATVSGRSVGALFFIGFGSAWLVFGLLLRGQFSWLTGAGVAAGGLGLGLLAMRLLAQARRLPLVEPEADVLARRKRAGTLFNWINAGQWVLVALLDWLLTRAGHQDLILPMVVTVIGLHFLPLAHLFGYPPHYVTGLLLLGLAIGCGMMRYPTDYWWLLALGTGVLLWVSAGYALGRAGAALKPA